MSLLKRRESPNFCKPTNQESCQVLPLTNTRVNLPTLDPNILRSTLTVKIWTDLIGLNHNKLISISVFLHNTSCKLYSNETLAMRNKWYTLASNQIRSALIQPSKRTFLTQNNPSTKILPANKMIVMIINQIQKKKRINYSIKKVMKFRVIYQQLLQPALLIVSNVGRGSNIRSKILKL